MIYLDKEFYGLFMQKKFNETYNFFIVYLFFLGEGY